MDASQNIEVFKIQLNNGQKGVNNFENQLKNTFQKKHLDNGNSLFSEFYSMFQNKISNRKKTRLEAYKNIFLKEESLTVSTYLTGLNQEKEKKVIRGEIANKFSFYMYTPFNYDVGILFVKRDPENKYCTPFLNQVENILDNGIEQNLTRIKKYIPKNLNLEFTNENQSIDFNSTSTLSTLYRLSIMYSSRSKNNLIGAA